MGQFTLSWDNSDVAASPNATGQRVSYRQKSVGGAWIDTGFNPNNDLGVNDNTAVSPTILNNVVYEFKVEALCASGGPTLNDNGIQEEIAFACIAPTIQNTDVTSQITLNLANTDITKVRFTLRKVSDNTVAHGPMDIVRIGNIVTTVAASLAPSTNYYWQVILFANINGGEVNSGQAGYINAVCGPYVITTDAAAAPLLAWIAGGSTCETEGGFGVVKTIPGLSSPARTWYDAVNDLVYVADNDDPNGNVYWFNPATATTQADMIYSAAVNDQELYNTYIDPIYRRMYFVGRNSGGLLVYDIDTDTTSVVPFGANGTAFSRITLTVTSTSIYCNYLATNLVIIDRAALTVSFNHNPASLPFPSHFTDTYNLTEVNGEIWVSSFNGNVPTVGVYSLDLLTHVTEITIPSASVWAGGFGRYWQTVFWETVNNRAYIGDVGSNRRHIVDAVTKTVIDTQVINNREGKLNVVMGWFTNPVTNELMVSFSGQNNVSDATPVKRVYLEDRNTFSYLDMFEGQGYGSLSHISGTNNLVGSFTGQPFWSGDPNYNTDGSITVVSNSLAGANTGKEIVTTLIEVDLNNGSLPTGNTKHNSPSDPDYIAPIDPSPDCPITYTLTCPTQKATTFLGTTLYWETAFDKSVLENPAIDKIQIFAYNTNTAAIEGLPVEYSTPFASKYYSGNFTGLGGTNYSILIKYLDSVGAVLQTCTP